jgi:hypothetical protein
MAAFDSQEAFWSPDASLLLVNLVQQVTTTFWASVSILQSSAIGETMKWDKYWFQAMIVEVL